MSYTLNSLNGGYIVEHYRVMKGHTRSSDLNHIVQSKTRELLSCFGFRVSR